MLDRLAARPAAAGLWLWGLMAKRKRARRRRSHAVPPAQLGGLLRDLAGWAIASSLGASPGCSGGHTPFDASRSAQSDAGSVAEGRRAVGGTAGPAGEMAVDVDEDAGHADMPDAARDGDWAPIDCKGRELPRVLAHVVFTRPLDFAAIYHSHPGGVSMTQYPAEAKGLDAFGSACATASDEQACVAAMSALRMPSDACVKESMCAGARADCARRSAAADRASGTSRARRSAPCAHDR